MARTIDLDSMVEIQDRPFLVIDSEFRIVAVNIAYEQAYNTNRSELIGQYCYKATHHNDRPCYEEGEDCPYHHLYLEGDPSCTCLHIHHDDNGRVHRVKIKAFPIRDQAGEIYIGELLEPLSSGLETNDRDIRMTGQSRVFLRMLEQLKLAALSQAPVLLEGETGTGKDLAARYIHQHSGRSENKFLTLDCTVLTESLFEAEVFGHERGAYTGSVGKKEGLFEVADGGTLFLDEISEMSPPLQAKFLRVLENGEFRRVGGTTTLRTNARIICATNRDLGKDVDANHFREDLYYRVACLHIAIPSLRDRLQDIPFIAQTLLEQITQTTGRKQELSAEAIDELQGYDYPGNIRELRNILQSTAASRCTECVIRREDVANVIERFRNKRTLRQPHPAPEHIHTDQTPEGGIRNPASLRDVEGHHIAHLVRQYNGNRRQIAQALGVSERTVYRKLKRHGLS